MKRTMIILGLSAVSAVLVVAIVVLSGAARLGEEFERA